MVGLGCKEANRNSSNPFFSDSKEPFNLPAFNKIEPKHYLPAFREGMLEQNKHIGEIIDNQEAPDFENTVVALDRSGRLLSNVIQVFFLMEDACSTDEIRAISEEITPLLAAHDDAIFMNEALFNKLKTVYENSASDSLNNAQMRLLDKYYQSFIRSGILLPEESKNRLKEINKILSDLQLQFKNNLLLETNDFRLIIDDETELSGLPDWAKQAASRLAESDSLHGKWTFNLQKSSFTPVLQYANNRSIREKIYKAYYNRGNNGNANDNKTIVSSIVKLRDEKAKLLGYDHFSNYKLERKMAGNPENVYALLHDVYKYALLKAKEELAEMRDIAKKEDADVPIEAWDWLYYAEKLRQSKYDLDEELLKPYFELENVRDGAFLVANKLFGISFSQVENAPVYHPDVKAFEVKDADGSHLGVLYTDYFSRPGKRAGAWMGNFREQYVENYTDIRPVVYNVANFAWPAENMPSLLNRDEVKILFHEFGHALHGLLSKCSYESISGTHAANDFVELPSQLMEYWAIHPDVLKMYAKHYETGQPIPDELIEKMQNAVFFNQGFTTTELAAAALLDMDFHTRDLPENFDVIAFEETVKSNLKLPPEIEFRYKSVNFNHIFGMEGYAAGYYGYLWSEVLVADVYEQFVKNGIFDQVTATAYRQIILEKGDSDDPAALFMQFNGAAPNADNLLKNKGLK